MDVSMNANEYYMDANKYLVEEDVTFVGIRLTFIGVLSMQHSDIHVVFFDVPSPFQPTHVSSHIHQG